MKDENLSTENFFISLFRGTKLIPVKHYLLQLFFKKPKCNFKLVSFLSIFLHLGFLKTNCSRTFVTCKSSAWSWVRVQPFMSQRR